MLTCKELTKIATDYLERELLQKERLRVHVHLWMCRHCRTYLDQMQKLVRMLKRLPKEAVPPELPRNLWHDSKTHGQKINS